MKKILITGGAGYVGSHTAYAAIDVGHQVAVIDNLSTGVRSSVPEACQFYQADIADQETILTIIQEFTPEVVIHFAGSVIVPESVRDPIKYYYNNSFASLSLINACIQSQIKYFIFSSTAAVYGLPDTEIVDENAVKMPITPYGQSKLMTEHMLHDVAKAYDFHYAALRYFNVAGADAALRCGQSTPQATHLIKVACETILGKHDTMKIFGTDYNTKDGTCIRDFIHVSDLAQAHLDVMDYIIKHKISEIFNCGNGQGYSVKEILDVAQKISDTQLNLEYTPRREGDSPALIANSSKLQQKTGWKPHYINIDDIVGSALEWEKKLFKMSTGS